MEFTIIALVLLAIAGFLYMSFKTVKKQNPHDPKNQPNTTGYKGTGSER